MELHSSQRCVSLLKFRGELSPQNYKIWAKCSLQSCEHQSQKLSPSVVFHIFSSPIRFNVIAHFLMFVNFY